MSPFKGPEYATALYQLHTLCFKEPWSLENFQKLLQLPTTFAFGDERGFVLCADLGIDVEILTLAVHPDERRKGIASTLLKTLQQWLILHQKQRLFLEVNENNRPALALYQKQGFIQTGLRKNYYHEDGHSFHAICMMWQK